MTRTLVFRVVVIWLIVTALCVVVATSGAHSSDPRAISGNPNVTCPCGGVFH